jgi:hypothetical protein
MPVKPNEKWARGYNSAYCFMADNIPELKTYREAEIHYEAVKPFSKGASKGKKPLGYNRRYDRVQIRKAYTEEDGLGKFIIKHYHTDIATYKEDGSFVFATGGYDSASTTQILQELFGLEKFGRRKGKAYYFDGIGHAYRFTHGLRVYADGHVDADSAYMESRHALDKNKFKEIKAKYQIFTDYAKMVTTMTQGGEAHATKIARGGYEDSRGYSARNVRHMLSCDQGPIHFNKKKHAELRAEFFNELDCAIEIADETQRMEAMMPLVEFVSFSATTDYSTRMENNDIRYTWKMDNKRLIYFFNEVLKFHYAKEVFTKEHIPLGTIAHDSNYKYIELSTEACLELTN